MQENEELVGTDEPPVDEELDDVLDDDAGEEDDDEVIVGTFEIDSLETGNGLPELSVDEDADEEEDDDEGDDLVPADVGLFVEDDEIVMGDFDDAAVGVGVGVGVATTSLERRVAELEAAARTLAQAEVEREGARVKRKVTAATTGAGAIGLLPALLQLVGAIDLPPSLAATASAAAAIIGAFGAGWVTPERTPPLPDASAHAVLRLGEDG
jgi:hypothetical protein